MMHRFAISIVLAAVPFEGLVADPPFLRGDADGSGRLSITDPILVLQYAFQGGLSPIGCLDAADADDDGAIGLTDAVLLLAYLFQAGPGPAEPFPSRGYDPTVEDALDCQVVPSNGDQCVIFCCDKSSSMSGAAWKREQQYVVQGITELDPAAQFAIVFFDSNLIKFPPSGVPVTATEEMKAAGLAMTMSSTTGAGSCPKPALILSLSFAEASSARIKRIVLLSDGKPACNGSDLDTYAKATLEEVTARNAGACRIDTIGIGPADGSVDENFLKVMAERNGGEFTRIVP